MYRRYRLFGSLRSRLILIVVAALLPAALYIGHEFLNHRQETLERAFEDAERQRDMLRRAYQRLLESSGQLLAALARVSVIQRQDPAASELLTALRAEHPVYLNLFANLPNGTVFASAEPLTASINSADSLWFRAAAERVGLTVGEFQIGKITGQPLLTLAYASRCSAGVLRAVVGASLPLGWFNAELQSRASSSDASIILFDADGELIADFGGASSPPPALLQQLAGIAHSSGTLMAGESREATVYAYAPLLETVSGRRVMFAVELPIRDALARADHLLLFYLSTWLLVVLLALLGSWKAARSFIEAPLERLLSATRQLNAGNLSARTGITRAPDELAELARHFDGMADTLQLREEDLRRSQAELARVAEENETKRREAEQRSEAYQRDLQAVMSRVQDVIFRLDREGCLVWATPSLESMSGYSFNELSNQGVCPCMAEPDSKEAFLARLERDGGTVHNFEVRLRRKDGEHRFAAINAQYIHDVAGTPTGVEGVARDITEQVRSREQLVTFNRGLEERVRERTAELERMNSELEAFTYSVSHDLRTPLRSMEGFAKLVEMRHGALLPDDGKDYLGRVQRAARRMAQLIDDLLSLSRISRHELALEVVDLSALAGEIIRELLVDAHHRQVNVHIQPGLHALCDQRLCRVALRNLLDNALKYSAPCDPAVIEMVATSDAHGRQVFCIRDNGVGFDMQYANKLFMPFQRLHSGEEFEGTGVGLATVKRVVQRHGGEIWVEAGLGEGARFFFRLPNADESAATNPTERK